MAFSEQQLLDYNRRLLRREMRELKFRVEALRLLKDELGRQIFG